MLGANLTSRDSPFHALTARAPNDRLANSVRVRGISRLPSAVALVHGRIQRSETKSWNGSPPGPLRHWAVGTWHRHRAPPASPRSYSSRVLEAYRWHVLGSPVRWQHGSSESVCHKCHQTLSNCAARMSLGRSQVRLIMYSFHKKIVLHHQEKSEIPTLRHCSLNSCNWYKRPGTSRLHRLHEPKLPSVSRIEFIRSKLRTFCSCIPGLWEGTSSEARSEWSGKHRILHTWRQADTGLVTEVTDFCPVRGGRAPCLRQLQPCQDCIY